jgi:hypothetical protein
MTFWGRRFSVNRSDRANRACLQLDPFFPGTNLHYGTLLFFSRQYDRAATQLAKTLDLYPDNAAAQEYFGNICAKRGMLHALVLGIEP